MTSVDPAVASVLDNRPHANQGGSSSSDDEADLLDSLDNDPTLSVYREQRLQQLHEEFTRAKRLRDHHSHGQYTEIKDEKTLMDIVNTGAELCVVHFFKPDFHRCGIMDGHLKKLAPLHTDTRFLRINVGNAPFLVEKLKVKVLPCVIGFRKGLGVDRVVGFEGVGEGGDTFETGDLERRLVGSAVLVREKLREGKEAGVVDGRQDGRGRTSQNEDDDDDWN